MLRRVPALRPRALGLTPRPVALRYPSPASMSRVTVPSRAMHVRAISFGTLPRMMARAFRVPLYGMAVGAGGFGYANYKLEGELLRSITKLTTGVRNATAEVLGNVKDTLSSAYDTTANTLGTVIEGASGALGALGNGVGALGNGVSDGAQGVLNEGKGRLDAFQKGTAEWWDAFTSQFSSQKPAREETTIRTSREEPGEGGEPGGPGGAGEAAALGAAAYAVSGDEEEEGVDPNTAKEHQLLQLTRKLIEIRQVLLSVDQSDALKLPSIVVIGSQSSGKSSVLEAIVGHEFLPK